VEECVTYKVIGKGNDLNIDLSFEFLADDKLLKMLNPLLHRYVCYNIGDPGRSRSPITSMPSNLDLQCSILWIEITLESKSE
jgi:hypothetical protein